MDLRFLLQAVPPASLSLWVTFDMGIWMLLFVAPFMCKKRLSTGVTRSQSFSEHMGLVSFIKNNTVSFKTQ